MEWNIKIVRELTPAIESFFSEKCKKKIILLDR